MSINYQDLLNPETLSESTLRDILKSVRDRLFSNSKQYISTSIYINIILLFFRNSLMYQIS
jgi:hypothetical protein